MGGPEPNHTLALCCLLWAGELSSGLSSALPCQEKINKAKQHLAYFILLQNQKGFVWTKR